MEKLKQLLALEMVNFAHKVLPREELLVDLLRLVSTEFKSISTILKDQRHTDEAQMVRSFGVLHKLGLITLEFDKAELANT